MKKVYERPVLVAEEFVANTAVAKCTVSGGINYTFDCMKGPNTDTASVIADAEFVEGTCKTTMGYAAGSNTAISYGTNSHSNNNSSIASWTTSGGGKGNNSSSYVKVTYSGEIDGLLYGTESGLVSGITVEKGIVTFASSVSGTHRQVAPVIDSYSVNASW